MPKLPFFKDFGCWPKILDYTLMCIYIHSRDYLKKISIQINVATDEGNGRNEIGHWANNEIAVAVQSWLWVRVELMAW